VAERVGAVLYGFGVDMSETGTMSLFADTRVFTGFKTECLGA